MRRANSFEKTLMLGKIEGGRRRGWQRIRWLDGITDSMDMSWASSGSWWRKGKLGLLQRMGPQRVRHDWATELNWTELGNIEWKSWGITPHLSGLLNSIYMTISTAGGWGKEISLTAGGMYLRPLYNTAVQCFPKPKHWIQQSCVQCCQLLWNFIPNLNKDAIMHSSTIHNS